MDVAEWLNSLDMGQYIGAFAAEGIDLSVVGALSDQGLKDIGVALIGHRRKIMAATAAALGASAPASPLSPPHATAPLPPTAAPPQRAGGWCRAPPPRGDVLRSRRLDQRRGDGSRIGRGLHARGDIRRVAEWLITPPFVASCSSASAIFSSTNFRTPIPCRRRYSSCSPPVTLGKQTGAVRPIPGKFFLVGGSKQSICRFRRADAALYEEVKERLRHVGAEVLYLTTGGGDADGRNKAETVVARGASRSPRRRRTLKLSGTSGGCRRRKGRAEALRNSWRR